jgi:hypothetical protein
MEQLIITGYAAHMNNDTYQCGKLVIEIDLPDPETCAERFNGMMEGYFRPEI